MDLIAISLGYNHLAIISSQVIITLLISCYKHIQSKKENLPKELRESEEQCPIERRSKL